MAITLRSVKGSALTHGELDGNFTDLDDRTVILTPGTANTLIGHDADGNTAEVAVAGSGATLSASTLTVTGAAATSNVAATAVANPFPLDASNKSDPAVGKQILVDDGANAVVLELQAGVVAPANWTIFRGESSTGIIYIIGATAAVTIDGAAGVGNTTSPTNAVWGTPTGNAVTITSATAGLPTFAQSALFSVRNHSNSANNGLYIVSGASTTSSLGATKISGSAPQAATAEAVDIDARPIGATMAPGRATAWLAMPQSNAARFEGEGTEDLLLQQSINANGKGLYGYRAGTQTVSGSMTAAAHGGKIMNTTGNVTVPATAGFKCTLVMGGAHTIAFAGGGTSAALAAGDLVWVIVDHNLAIHAERVLAANKLAFA